MNKIAIIGAMELEVDTLKASMNISNTKIHAGMEFFEGTLNNTPVVIVHCGIGKVNAGICVQILADLFHVTHIINTGIAGALNSKLKIGDILISKDALQHDVDITIFGYEKGQIPNIPTTFAADETLIDFALRSCEHISFDSAFYTGRIVSGDQFISSNEIKKRLITDFNGDCAEMEGAAIAQASYLNHLPFVIIRAISDSADDNVEMDYPTFERNAAKISARIVSNLLQYLS